MIAIPTAAWIRLADAWWQWSFALACAALVLLPSEALLVRWAAQPELQIGYAWPLIQAVMSFQNVPAPTSPGIWSEPSNRKPVESLATEAMLRVSSLG